MKIRTQYLSVAGVFLLCISVFAVVVSAQEVIDEKTAEAKALEVIQREASYIYPSWERAMPTSPVVYYDLLGIPSAYVFSVTKDNKCIGRVSIKAVAEEGKVLYFEYSENPPPHMKLETCRTIAEEWTKKKLGEPALVFVGGLDYYAVFSLPFAEKVVIGLLSKMILPYRELELLQYSFDKQMSSKQRALKAATDALRRDRLENVRLVKIVPQDSYYDSDVGREIQKKVWQLTFQFDRISEAVAEVDVRTFEVLNCMIAHRD